MTSIDVSQIPDLSGIAEKVEQAATGLGKPTAAVQRAGDRAEAIWSGHGLKSFYRAPEAATLLAAMGPVKAEVDTVASQTGTVVAALQEYAAEVRKIQTHLSALKAEAVHFNQTYMGDPDADTDDKVQGKRNDLIRGLGAWAIAFQAAQRTCANKINAMVGGPHYVPVEMQQDGNGRLPPGYVAWGAANYHDGMKMPWGQTTKKPDPAWLRFLKGAGGAAYDLVHAPFVLIDITEPDRMANAWTGIYHLAHGASPTTWVEAANGDHDARKALGAWRDLGKSLIAWDDWKHHNYAGALGRVGVNALTLGISELKLGKAGKLGDLPGGKVLRGAERVANAPMEGFNRLAGGAAGKIGDIAKRLNGLRGNPTGIVDPRTIRWRHDGPGFRGPGDNPLPAEGNPTGRPPTGGRPPALRHAEPDPLAPARRNDLPSKRPTLGELDEHHRRAIDKIGERYRHEFDRLDRKAGAHPGDPALRNERPPVMAGGPAREHGPYPVGGRTPHEINNSHSGPPRTGGPSGPPHEPPQHSGPAEPGGSTHDGPGAGEGGPGHPDTGHGPGGNEHPPPRSTTYVDESGHVKEVPDGYYRDPRDPQPMIRDDAHGRLHHPSDQPGTYRTENGYQLKRGSHFIKDPLAAKTKDITYHADLGTKVPLPLSDAVRSALGDLAHHRDTIYRRRQSLDTRLNGYMKEFGIKNKDLINSNDKVRDLTDRIRAEIERSHLSQAEKRQRLRDMRDFYKFARRYNTQGIYLSKASEQMGMTAAKDLLEHKLGARVLTPRDLAPGKSGTLDVTGVSTEGDKVVINIAEAKGVGSGLGSRLVDGLKRAEQGSPEYTRFLLARDPDLRAALEADPKLRELLQTKLAEGKLLVRSYYVHVNANGHATWAQFNLGNGGSTLSPGEVSGLDR
ncbi:hypothetical protein [Actinomadura verrucosospora]|uniref:Uncharacterized protein n=1 Tax=Actinomadura verrucosospora TaxID=46165 RepID=A0A7D3VUR5_ACTVE|nr:hypothetical protein [Actinomadura verrucosospora]QKG23459.1 hypothetical protein ACTIVE_5102 [Actinomadura verrucosospora]